MDTEHQAALLGISTGAKPGKYCTAAEWSGWSLEQLTAAVETPPPAPQRKDEARWWAFCRYSNDTRDGEAPALQVTALALDYDSEPAAGPDFIRQVWGRWRLLAHTTASHASGAPRWRVILPLASPITPEQLGKLKAWAMHPRRGAGKLDTSSFVAKQYSFMPGKRPGYESLVIVNRPPLDLREAVADLKRWRSDSALADELKAPPAGLWIPRGMKTLRDRQNGKVKPLTLGGGLEPVDQLLGGGLWPGCYVVCGLSGAGKSQVMIQGCLSVAHRFHSGITAGIPPAETGGAPVLYVALELGEAGLAARLIGLETGVSWSRVFRGDFRSEVERENIDGAEAVLSRLPIHLSEAPPMSWQPQQLTPQVRAIIDRYGVPPLVVLDYLQLIGGEEDKRRAIGDASYHLRQVSREFGAVTVAISSIPKSKYATLAPRKPRTLTGKAASTWEPVWRQGTDGARGLLGMGKESGEIEYAADGVLVLVAGPRDEGMDWWDVHIAAAKVRAGQAGWCRLQFNGGRFRKPITPEHDPDRVEPSTGGDEQPTKRFGRR